MDDFKPLVEPFSVHPGQQVVNFGRAQASSGTFLRTPGATVSEMWTSSNFFVNPSEQVEKKTGWASIKKTCFRGHVP